jgi:hypothetical protein
MIGDRLVIVVIGGDHLAWKRLGEEVEKHEHVGLLDQLEPVDSVPVEQPADRRLEALLPG